MNDDVPVPWVVVAILVLAGSMCYFAAASHLKDWNPMDFLMRGLPFEDLKPAGQALMIVSWLLAAAAAVVVAVNVFPQLGP